MIDSERQAVGTCYKQHGQQAALALGHRLVNGKLREQRTAAWLAACATASRLYLLLPRRAALAAGAAMAA